MGAESDLAIIVSANVDQLAADLRAAQKNIREFQKTAARSGGEFDIAGGAKAAAKEAAANKRAAAQAVAEHKRAAKDAREAWDKSFAGRGVAASKNFASSIASSAGSIPVAGLAIGVGAAATIAGIHGLAEAFSELKDSVNMAADLEQTTLAFEVMLQSADKAQQHLADVRKFAATTPFNNAELIDSSRKLIAYGLSAEQTVPTLRMLGDVAAATQTPISDLAYLYGTLAAQQRAYTKDIYQFANRGIPIYEELSKVLNKSVNETKDLIEEGRVGFPEVVRAFKAMTEGKGRYAGLTSRQADTFTGVREQMSDAIDMGKIKLGKIIIDEMGLKDAAKDFTKFVESVDLDRIRPVVRFFGDLGRSVAQVSYELGKASISGGEFLNRMAGSQFPEMGRFLADVRAFINSGKDFRIDPLVVNDVVFSAMDSLTDLFIGILQGIKQVGQGLADHIVTPLGKGFQSVLDGWHAAKRAIGQDSMAERYRPPAAFESNEAIVHRFRELDSGLREIDAEIAAHPLTPKFEGEGNKRAQLPEPKFTRPGEREFYQRSLEDLLRRRAERDGLRSQFLKEFDVPNQGQDAAPWLFDKGQVPPMHNRRFVTGSGTAEGSLSSMIKWWEEAKQRLRKTHEEIGKQLKEDKAQRDAATGSAQLIAATQEAAAAFNGLSGWANVAAGELAKVKAPPKVEVPWAIPPEVLDAVKAAKENFKDPVKEFHKQWNALGQGVLYGELSPDQYVPAAADLLRKTGMMMGGATQLPDGALSGSVEATRLINRAMFGGQQDTANDFLARLVRLAEEKAQRDRELLRKAAIPITVAAPK